MDQTRRFETSYSCRHSCSPSDFSWKIATVAGGPSEAVKRPSGSKTSLPPSLRRFKAEQSTPVCSKTSSPSTAASRGGGWADCGGGGRERRPHSRTKKNEVEDAIDYEEDDASCNYESEEVVSEGVKTTSFLHESPIVYDSSEEVVSEGVKTTSFLHESPIVESTALSPSHDDSNASADANGGMFLLDASAPRTSGSSRVSSPAIGIHDGCIVSASPTVVPESLTPPPVDTQTRESVEGDAVDAPTIARPQRALLGRLIEDDLL